MTGFWKIAASATCVAAICGAAILWPVYKGKSIDRKLAAATKVRAEHGDVKAQNSLGSMYYYGKGVPKDFVGSVRWYRKAAEQGYAAGQFDLGLMYHRGFAVPQDHAEAARWYRKAADQGEAKAQASLGYMYIRGDGVPQDYGEAVRWYRKAADRGDATAQERLGHMYLRGEGVPPDSAESVRWYRKAADHGDSTAQGALGYIYFHGEGVPRDNAESVRWYRKAAEQGDSHSQAVLFNLYYRGQGVPRNYVQAAYWFGKIGASCFTRGGPLAAWASVGVIVLALPIVMVPQRRWGRAAWLPTALCSLMCAAMFVRELLNPGSIATRLAHGLFGTGYGGVARDLWLALFAGLSVIYALAAVVGAARGVPREG